MLKLQNTKADIAPSVNLMPMLDVVFLILIFFLLTSIVTAKPVLKLDLPTSPTAKSSPVKQHINISIQEDGTLFLNESAITIPGLTTWLQENANTLSPKSLLISADKTAPFGVFVQVLELLQKSHFKQVDILTEIKPPS